jgi:hypothetical protein
MLEGTNLLFRRQLTDFCKFIHVIKRPMIEPYRRLDID